MNPLAHTWNGKQQFEALTTEFYFKIFLKNAGIFLNKEQENPCRDMAAIPPP